MRLARKLTLLAVMAIAAMAVAAPSAFAQTEPLAHDQDTGGVIVNQEPAGTACPAVTPVAPPATPEVFAAAGGCRVHISGTAIVLTAHVFGIESTDSTCNVEMDMRVDSGGEGWLSHLEFTQGATGTCTRRACHQTEAGTPPPTGQSEGRPWGFYGDETGPGTEVIRALFCVEPRGNPNGALTHCDITLPLTQTAVHRYRVIGTDTPCSGTAGFRGEITGTLAVEAALGTTGEGQAEQNVEIAH